MTNQRLQRLINATLGPRPRETLHRKRALRLHRMRALLAALKHPEAHFLTIQILGTSGKGSTAALLSSVLTAARIPVGLSTKPFLVSPTEHFRVNDEECSLHDLRTGLTAMRPAVRMTEAQLHESLTLFEILTGLGALLFTRSKVRVGIFESGLGGKTDATTELHAPVKVLTSIGLDHTKSLGPTIPAITRQKAGAIRTDDFVISSARGQALNIIQSAVKKRGAHFIASTAALGSSSQTRWSGTRFRWKKTQYHTSLIGPHQADNASAVLATIAELRRRGFRIPDSAVIRGLSAVRWPGRFSVLPTRPKIILDGAHNPSKIAALVETLAALTIPRKRVLCIFACKKTKDARTMLQLLAPACRELFYPTLHGVKGLVPQRQLTAFAPGQRATSLGAALRAARAAARPNDIILVTGSLTLVGEYYSHHHS